MRHVEKGVKLIIEDKNAAMIKVQKLEEENRQLALMVEQSSAVQSSRAALEHSELSLVKAKLDNATIDLENERAKSRQLESQLKHNEGKLFYRENTVRTFFFLICYQMPEKILSALLLFK